VQSRHKSHLWIAIFNGAGDRAKCGKTWGSAMHRQLIVATSVLVLAVTSAPAWAGWGCGAKSANGAQGRNWSQSSKAAAIADAMHVCRDEGGTKCRIMSCRANVDTEEQALALWPPDTPLSCGPGLGKC